MSLAHRFTDVSGVYRTVPQTVTMLLLSVIRDLPVSVLVTSFALASLALPTVRTAELTPTTFKESTANGLWFVEHFSPHCSHCRNFAPTWEKLVVDMEKETPSVSLAQVNCLLYGGA